MTPEPALRDALLAAVPSLRAFAISLCGQVDRADDLVQDTLLRALSNLDRFERGTYLNPNLLEAATSAQPLSAVEPSGSSRV